MRKSRQTKQFQDWSTILSGRAGRGSCVRVTYTGKFHVTLTELNEQQFSDLFAVILKPYVEVAWIEGKRIVFTGPTQHDVDYQMKVFGVKPIHRIAPIPKDATPEQILATWKALQVARGIHPDQAFQQLFANKKRKRKSPRV